MPMDANNTELTTSNNSETFDDVVVDTTDSTADSSAATSDDQADTLSIVRDVVEAGREKPADQASQAAGGESDQKPEDPATKKEPDDEGYSDVPFHKHPRFKQLLEERNSYKADATMYRNVQNFMDTNGISAEEAADGFVIMGLLKTDPPAAWARLKPIVESLLVASGEMLPEDLQGRVQRGEMSAEAAFELSRTRAKVQTVERGQSFREQQARVNQEREAANSIYNTAVAWEQDRRAKDPNFEAKLVPMQKELAFIQMREGKPNTPQGVQDQLKRAYEAVVLPARAPVNPPPRPKTPLVRSSAGGQSGQAQPQPQSTRDIIRNVVGKR